MKRFSTHKIIFAILGCACCVDPFNTSLSVKKTLVVDGLMTDQTGPHSVTLSYSSDIGTGVFTREAATGGVVTIIDNTGLQTLLNETTPGVYQTDSSFMALAGKSYSLKINISGENYESDVEPLLPAGRLDSLYFILDNSPIAQFKVYANSSKSEGNGQMRWRSSFIYQVQTQPSLHIGEGGGIQPLLCSGASTIPATPCTCCFCWVYGQNSEVKVSDESNFIGDNFNGNLVATIPIGDKQFEFKYYLQVDLLSLSSDAYTFWNLLRSQQTGAADLFQPVSARIPGNIHSITNPDQQVLGLFQVSSIISKSIFINRTDIPLTLQPVIPTEPDDCRSQGTNVRPPFW